jgi:hypothetical protein
MLRFAPRVKLRSHRMLKARGTVYKDISTNPAGVVLFIVCVHE